MTGFDPIDGCLDEAAEFLPLLSRDRGLEVLDLGGCFRTNTTNATSEIPVIQE